MARDVRHALAGLAFLLAAAARAGGPAWESASRSFSLAPGSFEAADWASGSGLGGRSLDAYLRHRSGVGLDLDGELWRVRAGGAAQAVAAGDVALSLRALEHGSFAVDLLGGARIDASSTPSAALPLDAWAAPMAGARATLGIAPGTTASLRASAAPDRSLDASWRVSAALRVELADGWAFVADLRWSSQPSPVPGADPGDGLGRASAWAGLTLPF